MYLNNTAINSCVFHFTPEPLRTVRVLFSPMVSGWAAGWVVGKSLPGLYLINREVPEVDTWDIG